MKNSKNILDLWAKSEKKDRYYIHNLKKKIPVFFTRVIEASFQTFFPQNPFIISGCYAINPPPHSFSVEYLIFVNISKILIKFQRAFEQISYKVRDFPRTKSINRYADANAHAEQNQTAIMIIFYNCFFQSRNSGFPIFLRS